ncbi:hypothetical protein [Rhabdaerophilum calidifontis]|uniref:hypothetical protein n=1 Tax=Rhabdaerophilum calidifontis TaxID=2604328 RepID=UPI00123867C8|nr:hypothetical protein [Rhabdaerophilum calidifontis]
MRPCSRLAPLMPPILAPLLAALALAGCAGQSMTATAPANAAGMKFAVISVQGPQPETAQKFQILLDEAARRRGFEIVPAASPGEAVRVNAYLDAHTAADGKAGFTWVLDASGDGRNRAARVNGAAASDRPGGTPWSALDEAAMRQIAEAGLTDLLRRLSGAPGAAAPGSEDEAQ